MKSIILAFASLALVVLVLSCCGQANFISDSLRDSKEDTFIVRNMDNIRGLPRNFRLMTSAYQRHSGSIPTRKGLSKLKASGSSQFSKKGFKALLKTIPSSKIIIVDLRQESHGFFDGSAVSWYGPRNWQNMNKPNEQVDREELEHLNKVIEQGYTRIRNDKEDLYAYPLHVEVVQSEKEIASEFGVSYVRFYVTDHCRPDDSIIDDFITFVKNLPEDAWLHFHCAAGKGRTTTFLSMYDMLKNCHDVSYEDIVRRQWFLGGSDLTTHAYSYHWKHVPSVERLEFLKQFYSYCKANPDLKLSWTQWLKQLKKS